LGGVGTLFQKGSDISINKNMSKLKTWVIASRPKTLPAGLVPVVMGTAMAYGDGVHHFLSAFAALFCALLIQVTTNFVNDYEDFKKGTDDPNRIGPLRVTQAGLVTPKQMMRAIIIVICVTVLAGLYLVFRGGLPVLIIGVLCIVFGILYTAGPYSLGYHGLGDIFVLIFFGPVALAGTYYVQALTVNWVVIAVGLAPGLISVGILTVNNLRDYEGDKKANKKTLAVRFGRSFAMKEYFYSLLVACLLPIVIYMITGKHKMMVLSALTLLFTPGVLRVIFSETDGPVLNNALASTGKLLVVYGILFSIGWNL
jgi:1,4-dihydroxy-2-naphthoate polyprenyltransferase